MSREPVSNARVLTPENGGPNPNRCSTATTCLFSSDSSSATRIGDFKGCKVFVPAGWMSRSADYKYEMTAPIPPKNTKVCYDSYTGSDLCSFAHYHMLLEDGSVASWDGEVFNYNSPTDGTSCSLTQTLNRGSLYGGDECKTTGHTEASAFYAHGDHNTYVSLDAFVFKDVARDSGGRIPQEVIFTGTPDGFNSLPGSRMYGYGLTCPTMETSWLSADRRITHSI